MPVRPRPASEQQRKRTSEFSWSLSYLLFSVFDLCGALISDQDPLHLYVRKAEAKTIMTSFQLKKFNRPFRTGGCTCVAAFRKEDIQSPRSVKIGANDRRARTNVLRAS